MNNPTDTNQASEDELDKLCPICKGTTWQMNSDYEEVPCWHDIHDEGFKQAIKSFIRTEKLKLLAEVRERVVGEDETAAISGLGRPDIFRDIVRDEFRANQRTELIKLEAEL